MSGMLPIQIFNHVVSVTASRMQPLGYCRRGQSMRIMHEDNCGIVEFQRSQNSVADKILFTVNIGVIYGSLLSHYRDRLTNAKSMDGHVRCRIGTFLPDHPDKWWDVSASTDPDILSLELSDLIVSECVPFIDQYLRVESVIELWETGKSPGLTDKQRKRLLSMLKSTVNRKMEGDAGR